MGSQRKDELSVPQLKLEAAVSADWSPGCGGREGDRHVRGRGIRQEEIHKDVH